MADNNTTTAAPATPAPAAIDAKAVPADPKAAPAEPTQEFIVNGKPVKLTAAQVKVAVQKGLFADQKLKSVDVLQSTTKKLLEDMKTPDGLLRILKDPALGANPKEVFKKLMASDVVDDDLKETMAKWVYDNVVAQAKKTPEQIENEKKLTDYEKLKAEKAEREKEQLSQQQQAEVQKVYQAVRAEVTKQILADKTFPQTEGSIRQVVEKLRVMNKKGAPITTESVGKALTLVKKDHLLHQQSMFDALEDPEGLIALIGEARALKISKALIARLKNKANSKVAPTEKAQDEDAPKKITDRIDEKFGRTKSGHYVLKV